MGLRPRALLLEHQQRPAHALRVEIDIYFNAVCDLDERDALIIP
jgi:hypothetical protein